MSNTKIDKPLVLTWPGKPIGLNVPKQVFTLKIYTCYLTENKCFQSQTSIMSTQNNKIQGIVVHSTGAANTEVRRYVQPVSNSNFDAGNSLGNNSYNVLMEALGKNIYGNSWNQYTPDGDSKCVHAFLGYNEDHNEIVAVNTLPYTFACWGCGIKGASFNYSPNGRIQFEICEENFSKISKDRPSDYFVKSFVGAAMYCAYLCIRLGINPMLALNPSNTESSIKGTALDGLVDFKEINGKKVGTDSKFISGAMKYTLNGSSHRYSASDAKVSNTHSTDYYATYIDDDGDRFYPMREKDAKRNSSNWLVPSILSHKEAYDVGLGSGHGDPDHWLDHYGLDMNWFRDLVSQIYAESGAPIQTIDDSGKVVFTQYKEDGLFRCNGKGAYYVMTKMSNRSIYNSNLYLNKSPSQNGSSPSTSANVQSASKPSSSSSSPSVSTSAIVAGTVGSVLSSGVLHSGSTGVLSWDKLSNGRAIIDGKDIELYSTLWCYGWNGALVTFNKRADYYSSVMTPSHVHQASSDNVLAVAKYLKNPELYFGSENYVNENDVNIGSGSYPALNDAAIVGILANIKSEGTFMPASWATDDGELGGGLFGWRTYKLHTKDNADFQRGAFFQLVYYCNRFVCKKLGETYVKTSCQGTPVTVGTSIYDFMKKTYWQNPKDLINKAKNKGFKNEHSYLGLIAQVWFMMFYCNVYHIDYFKNTLRTYYNQESSVYPTNFGKNYYKDGDSILQFLNRLPNNREGAREAAAVFCAVVENPGDIKNALDTRSDIAADLWDYLSC